jgi:hypothetical protein
MTPTTIAVFPVEGVSIKRGSAYYNARGPLDPGCNKRRRRGVSIACVTAGCERVAHGFTVPRELRLTSVCGGAVFDLSRSEFVHAETHVHARAVCGVVTVVVPPGVGVENRSACVLGSLRVPLVPASSGAPRVVVHGCAFLGGRIVVRVADGAPALSVVAAPPSDGVPVVLV